ncbi:MAG TPA: hypothetical protein VIC57_17355 [Candidatus Dormibacteraeota bacterium]
MQITPKALVVLAALPLLAAACSVANPFAPARAADRASADQQRLKWAQCMRQHGQDVPDPAPDGTATRVQTTSGEGGSGKVVNGPDPDSPGFQAAVDACKQYAPQGAQGPGKIDQQTLDRLTKFAQCMRDHGIPMSDPQVDGGGVRISASAAPGTGVAPDSDQFQQAQKACQQYMPTPRAAP